MVRLDAGNLVRSSNRRGSFRHTCTQLRGHGHSREVVPTSELGMAKDESRTQGERDEENECDGCEATVGNRFALPRGTGLFGPVLASVQKAVFESPMLGKIHPAVVLLLP